MARKNRLVVTDGVYHVTTRVANRAFLFRDDELKDRIVEWMYGAADFSGVELLSWCVMENHLHMLVHVPDVPERLWLDGSCPPSTSAFTLRPAECNPPRWSPEGDSPQPYCTCPPAEDAPRPSSVRPSSSAEDWSLATWDGPRPRPPVGFTLSDEEMVERLVGLYGQRAAEAKGRHWAGMRDDGRDAEVDAEKERYCRRMYNISQFVKTLKERIAMRYNNGTYKLDDGRREDSRRVPEHAGHLFEGRFHSVLVERTREGYGAVASYIGVNPVKAGIADSPEAWRWSSFAVAVHGKSAYSMRCRKVYERMFGCGWEEAKVLMERLMSDRLPEGFDQERDGVSYMEADEEGIPRRRPLRVTQAIWLRLRAFTRGVVIARNPSFVNDILARHPKGFPHGGTWSADFCGRLDWSHVA